VFTGISVLLRFSLRTSRVSPALQRGEASHTV